MAKTVCKILGVAFLLAGVLGFVNPMLLGFHLTPVHNVVHLATAAVALYLGFAGSLSAARVFFLAFGAVELTPDNLFHIVVGGVFLAAGLATSTVEARPARA
jgi:hypothetical protein